MTEYMDEASRARDGVLSHDAPHPSGCVCQGLDGVCPDALRRTRARALRREMEDGTAQASALTAAADKGERVVGLGQPPRVLDPREVLARYEEGQG